MKKAGENPIMITQNEGPTPGTSGEPGDGYIPMDNNAENNDDVIEVQDETSKPSKKRKSDNVEQDSPPRFDPSRFKNKKQKTQQLEDKRSMFLESISESLSSMANFVSPAHEESTEEDYDLGWAKLLVPKIKAMPPRVKEKFKVHVDGLAVDAMNDEWP